MDKDTDKLLAELNNISSLDDFYKNHAQELNFPNAIDYLLQRAASRKLTKADLIRKTGLDRSYAYHILAGKKKLTRDKLLTFALAAGLTLTEAQNALKYAGERHLYARDKRDWVFIYALHRHLSVIDTNELLSHFKLTMLNE
jgi:transcriptional regulator with XRE-family HTH domain